MKKKIYNYHEKIFFGTEPGWATAQVSLRLGRALGWALGAGRAGTAQATWARGRGARWEWQAWARGAQASSRAEQHGMARGARRQLGRRAHDMAQQERGAAGWAACARLVCAAGPGWVFCCT